MLLKIRSYPTNLTAQMTTFFLRHQFFRSHRAEASRAPVIVSTRDASAMGAERAHALTYGDGPFLKRKSDGKSHAGLASPASDGPLSSVWCCGNPKEEDCPPNININNISLLAHSTNEASTAHCQSTTIGEGDSSSGSAESNSVSQSIIGIAERSTNNRPAHEFHFKDRLQINLGPRIREATAAIGKKGSLGLLPLVGLMFCTSIGGSYGLEESLGAGGAFYTLIGVIILPIVWAFPVSLVVAELATAIPTNGGFLTWINVSMPPTVYFFSVLITLMLTFIDNAAFPVLFADYVCPMEQINKSLPPNHSIMSPEPFVALATQSSSSPTSTTSALYTCTTFENMCARLAAVAVSCVLNILGIQAVGFASIAIAAMSLCPFALMFVIHMVRTGGYVNVSNILSSYTMGGSKQGHITGAQLSSLLPALTWNLSGLEQAGSLAEDVKDPQRSFIKAALITIGLAWLSYIPPVVAAVSRHGVAREDWGLWVAGYWNTVAMDIGGRPLYWLTVAGGVFSMFGLLLSAVCLTSRLLVGIGEAGAFPRPVSTILQGQNKRFATPHWSIIINTIFTGICAVSLDFSSLVAIDQALYGIRILLIFMACIKLRYAYPTLDRPFKIPLSADTLTLALSGPIAYCCIVTIASVSGSRSTQLGFAALMLFLFSISHMYVRVARPFGFDGRVLAVEVSAPGSGLAADSPQMLGHICAFTSEVHLSGGGIVQTPVGSPIPTPPAQSHATNTSIFAGPSSITSNNKYLSLSHLEGRTDTLTCRREPSPKPLDRKW